MLAPVETGNLTAFDDLAAAAIIDPRAEAVGQRSPTPTPTRRPPLGWPRSSTRRWSRTATPTPTSSTGSPTPSGTHSLTPTAQETPVRTVLETSYLMPAASTRSKLAILVGFVLALGLLAFTLWALIEAIGRPAEQWAAAGQSKALWLGVIVGVAILGFGGLGWVGALLYALIARPALKRAAGTAQPPAQPPAGPYAGPPFSRTYGPVEPRPAPERPES